jgi:glycosyltransferase involved in cell wall biosynthesis
MDRVLCVSRAVTAAVAAIGVPGEFLFTHYLGVPLGMTPLNDARSSIRQDLSIADDASIMLTVGFPTPVKGIDVVVDAFLDHLAESFPSLHLVIVGVRPYQRALASVRADRLPGRIHWVGIQDDVWRYMTAADVYIQASRSEALGLAILEAMARGVPVVGTSVGGIPEVILDGENGLLVPPASPAELAHAVTRLLNDEALRARFARAGRETCEHRFDIVQSAQALVEDHYQFGPSARMRLA